MSGSGWFSADGSVWEKDKYCLRFDDVIMQGYDRRGLVSWPFDAVPGLEPVKLRSDCCLAQVLGADVEPGSRAIRHGTWG